MLNTSTTSNFYVITCKDNPFIFYFRKIHGLNVIFADEFIKKINHDEGRLSRFAYARLILFDKNSIFSKYKFNLYVDNDTIALRNIDKNLLSVGNSMDKAIGIVMENHKNNNAI